MPWVKGIQFPRVCEQCKSVFFVPPSWQAHKYCSRPCRKKGVTTPAIDRFFTHLSKKMPSGCIEWLGARSCEGYGYFNTGTGKSMSHRFSYDYFVGTIPDSLCVLHSCDNPPCINPTHLFLGTRIKNNADRDSKSRQSRGEGCPLSILTEVDVLEIRRKLAAGVPQPILAAEYHVSRGAICGINIRRTWKHI